MLKLLKIIFKKIFNQKNKIILNQIKEILYINNTKNIMKILKYKLSYKMFKT
jgi:hypothetical protein